MSSDEIVIPDEREQKLKELEVYKELVRLTEEKQRLMDELPFIYKLKHYQWSREFYESKKKKNVLVAANQLGKSTVQIRKCIHWATSPEMWAELWPETHKKGLKPNLFWYLYPSKQLATEEFLTKWMPLLPQGKMKDDPVYGWKEVWQSREIYSIEFNSGVMVIFKTYSQKAQDLQTGTVYALFIDEEPPVDILSELLMRTSGVDGYISAVFTATLNQDFFRRVIEPKEGEKEEWEDAGKWQVSLYDSQYFEDGTESEWTEKRIKSAESRCTSALEIQRRIYGKFIREGGVRIDTFDPEKHLIKEHHVPANWLIYSAVDFGTGQNRDGKRTHPSAITFLAVSPDFRQGRVIKGRRFDNIPMTTIQLAQEYKMLEGSLAPVVRGYDWHAAEFEVHARALGLTFTRADKSQDIGTNLVRTLFKTNMLKIFDTPELNKLATELQTLPTEMTKTMDQDDFFDSLRYCCMLVPWDLTWYTEAESEMKDLILDPPKPREQTQEDLRREFVMGGTIVEDDYSFDEWNNLY